MDAGLQFVAERKGRPARHAAPSPVAVRHRAFDARQDASNHFTPFAIFAAGPLAGRRDRFPAPRSGKAVLRAAGGEPGEQPGRP